MAVATGIMNVSEYIDGLMYCFYTDEITYALTKMAFFAFFITTISAYCGYYAKGNSLEVGKASTKAVVVSSIVIMICNLVLTQLIRT
jgi:phospholipid/cholesterol/gamma-HCH transport system permease protein